MPGGVEGNIDQCVRGETVMLDPVDQPVEYGDVGRYLIEPRSFWDHQRVPNEPRMVWYPG